MTARPHECGTCGRLFKSARDHMLHVMEHDRGFVPRGERRRRKVSCWACASEMPVPEGDDPYKCECGFVLPPKLNEGEVTSADADN